MRNINRQPQRPLPDGRGSDTQAFRILGERSILQAKTQYPIKAKAQYFPEAEPQSEPRPLGSGCRALSLSGEQYLRDAKAQSEPRPTGSGWSARLASFAAPLALAILLASAAFADDPKPLPVGYAGSDACSACHEDISTAFTKNPHHAVDSDKKRGWQGRACEACHGPAQKHTETVSADDIRNPSKLAAAETDKLCLTCHLGQPTHTGRLQSSHARNQISCTACHKIHANGPFGLVARKPAAIEEQCATCHTNVVAQFQKPFHHKVPEGAMTCVDCHNPHGSIRPAMAQSFGANEPGCLKCHGDKRGPFTFEHAPVRFESCATCHEPHGSANPRMLTRPVVSQLCLECHANLPTVPGSGGVSGVVPPAFHDMRSPRFQNCTVCHQKIHGSHVDRNLLK